MHRGFSLVSSLSSISELSASTANINLNSSTALSEQEQHEIAMEEAKRQRVNIIRGLCSSSTRSKLESMRKILALTLKYGEDKNSGLEYFAEVAKTVADPSIELRLLAYVYLARHAHEEPDLALLAINSIQKDLMDPNQLVRASALRCFAGVNVPAVAAVLMLSIKKCMRDTSPFVRKVAAYAIIQLHKNGAQDLDYDELSRFIGKLLSDDSTLVVGGAIMAFQQVCPGRWDLIHRNFRKLCRMLPDLDGWSQAITVRVLERYVRENLNCPPSNAFHASSESANYSKSNGNEAGVTDTDLLLYLDACESLLNSQEYSVVAQVVLAIARCGTQDLFNRICILPLLRPIRWQTADQILSLRLIDHFTRRWPSTCHAFIDYHQEFFLAARDDHTARRLKVDILSRLTTEHNVTRILMDCEHHFHSVDIGVVQDMIRLVRNCAGRFPRVSEECLSVFMQLAQLDEEEIVASAIEAITDLITGSPAPHSHAIETIASNYHHLTSPAAKSCIYWLLGQFCELCPSSIIPLLRIATETFAKEESTVKLQMLNMATKVFLWDSQLTVELANKIFDLASTDSDMDLRDRWRLFGVLLFGDDGKPASERQHLMNDGRGLFNDLDCLSAVFFANRSAVSGDAPVDGHTGSGEDVGGDEKDLLAASHVLNVKLPGYLPIPEWTNQPSDPELRGPTVDSKASSPWVSPAVSPRQLSFSVISPPTMAETELTAESPLIPQPTLVKPTDIPDLESFLNG